MFSQEQHSNVPAFGVLSSSSSSSHGGSSSGGAVRTVVDGNNSTHHLYQCCVTQLHQHLKDAKPFGKSQLFLST